MTKRFFIGLLCAMLFLVPLSVHAAEITVDGLDNDWADIEPLGQSITRFTTLWAFIADDNLHVLVKGRMGDWNDIFLDVDCDPATGHQSWIWPGEMGGDYLMEDGLLFVSTGPGWEWAEVGSFEYATTGEGDEKIIEMILPLEMVGLDGDSKFFMGFSGGEQYVPTSGKKPFVFND